MEDLQSLTLRVPPGFSQDAPVSPLFSLSERSNCTYDFAHKHALSVNEILKLMNATSLNHLVAMIQREFNKNKFKTFNGGYSKSRYKQGIKIIHKNFLMLPKPSD